MATKRKLVTEKKVARFIARKFQALPRSTGVLRVSTFEEAMVLTHDEGIVVRFEDGTRAFITVQVQRDRG